MPAGLIPSPDGRPHGVVWGSWGRGGSWPGRPTKPPSRSQAQKNAIDRVGDLSTRFPPPAPLSRPRCVGLTDASVAEMLVQPTRPYVVEFDGESEPAYAPLESSLLEFCDQTRRKADAFKPGMCCQLPDRARTSLLREVDAALRDRKSVGTHDQIHDLACVDALQLPRHVAQMRSASRPGDLVDRAGFQWRHLEGRSATDDRTPQHGVVDVCHETVWSNAACDTPPIPAPEGRLPRHRPTGVRGRLSISSRSRVLG
jgi:hypothetical protein